MRTLWALLCVCVAADAAAASPRTDQILIQGNKQGSQSVATGADGSVRAEYSYNDRGRGDHIVATWKVDAAGIPIEYTGTGNDYMKAPVEEHFTLEDGNASWKNRTENGETVAKAPAFYIPANAPPEMFGVLARALLKAPNHTLALLPAGEARLEAAGSLKAAGGTRTLTEYLITGLGFQPASIWLDADGSTAGMVSSWFSVVPPGIEGDIPAMTQAQDKADNARSARLAKELAHVPRGDLVIRNARLYDPRDLSVTDHTSVLVRGERIVRIARDGDLKDAKADAEVIDAGGKFLMPGLWDNHQHFGDVDGMLDLANGVTSARDMANDTD